MSWDPPPKQVDETDAEELIEEIERRRSLRGVGAAIVAAVGLLFSTYQLFLAAQGFEFGFRVPGVAEIEIASLQLLQANAVHVGFALVMSFLLFLSSTGDGALARRLGRVVPWLAARAGEDSPVTAAVRRLRGGCPVALFRS